MSDTFLKLMKQAGDEHVGQTLTRLANLAVTAHWFEQAQEDLEDIGPELRLVGTTDDADEPKGPYPFSAEAQA